MKIVAINSLDIPEIKIIRFVRFCDQRGFFSETFRKSDFFGHPDMKFMEGVEFVQSNESFSRKGTVRGLHFQWNPYMGKLVRTITGRMIDLILDIRKGSPYFGKIIAYDMAGNNNADYGEWIWIPPGFAHGNFFPEDTIIQYFCSGEYNPNCEAGISPLAQDIDWSLCEKKLKRMFDDIILENPLITEKDKKGFSMEKWEKDERSENFIYEKI